MKIIFTTLITLTMLCACQAQHQSQDHKERDSKDKIQALSVDGLPALGAYSTAVQANGMLYVSGIIAFNPETSSFAPANVEAQTKQIFTNLDKVLIASGSSLTDIVKTSIYLKNPADFPKMNEIYSTYFPDYKPARTTVPGVDWGREDILIEIDFIVKLP